MKRKDKRPDRVEISPEDLSLGMVDADELNTIINGREQSATERNQMTAEGDSQEQPPQVSKFESKLKSFSATWSRDRCSLVLPYH